MNERIEELFKQAHTEETIQDNWRSSDTYKIKTLDPNLFAELIIKECCDMFVELRTRPADLAAKDVKQHFGINTD